MSARSYLNMYKFKYCKTMCETNNDKCTYGTYCKDTNITTDGGNGTVRLYSNTINFDASNNIKLNDIQISGNEISSENDIILMTENLDISANNLNIKSNNTIDISSSQLDISANDILLYGENLDISNTNMDIHTQNLGISVNTVNVTIGGNRFEFEKSNSTSGEILIRDVQHSNTYYLDGSNNENACSIM